MAADYDPMRAGLKLLYLVHDLCDPAVTKRVVMLLEGGAMVTVAGFRRTTAPVESVAGCSAIDLGQTHNGRFVQRLLAVLHQVITLNRHRSIFVDADLILARNLEMLAIGVRGRSLCTPKPGLVYECLDIHRLLLNPGPLGRALRSLEGWLAKRASALITSSPGFINEYFEKLSGVRLPIRLIENKVFVREENTPPIKIERTPGPPWRIGWFGAIRCAESLRILNDLVRNSAGMIEVVIRGRPALDQFDDFAKDTTETTGLQFLGPYANPADLGAIYRDVHFTWAIDRFEAGENSSWLLPNRLYEGGLYASVSIAEKSVETGRFLNKLGIGVTLPDPLEQSLAAFFAALTPEGYRELESVATNVSRKTWICNTEDCQNLVVWLGSQARNAR